MPCKPLFCMCGRYTFPQRYVMSILIFFAIAGAFTQRVSLNLTINAMVYKPPKNITGVETYCPVDVTPGNGTEKQVLLYWSPLEQSIAKLTFFVGYVLFQMSGGFIADRLGGRLVMSASLAFSTTACILSPAAVEWGGWILLSVVRTFMGFAQAVLYPSVYSMMAKWIPQNERATLATFSFSGSHFGLIIGSAISGVITYYAPKWSFTFYFWGFVVMIWFIVFVYFGYSDPETHPHISDEEKTYLTEKIAKKTQTKVPYKDILSDIHLWATISGVCAHDFMFYLLVTDLPNFMQNVMGFDIKNNGFLTAVPFVAYWCSTQIFGRIADFFVNKGVKIIYIRRTATFIGNIAASSCLLLAPYVGCNRIAVIAVFVCSLILKSPIYSGAFVNHLDRTTHFGGAVAGITNGLGAMAGVITPYLVAAVAYDHTIQQWRIVFWVNWIVASSLSIFAIIFMSGDRAKWDIAHDKDNLNL